MIHGRTRAAALGVLLLAAFAVLGLLVGERPLPWDFDVRDTFLGDFRGTAGTVTDVISDVLLGPALPVGLGLVLLVAALRARRAGDRTRASVLLRVIVVLALCRLTSFLAKPLFGRDRPRVYPDESFPSGHVVSVASFAAGVLLLTAWLAPRLLRRVAMAAVLATVLAALCRLILGVHWLTDTVGAVLGVAGVALVTGAALRLLPVDRDRAVTERTAA
ncbi:phosphatidic acid phosphatase [Amycolatopsis antarctica]|uniref:Phosphatidic acid phosphatase n=1 Tax=Amycolatopsis antarctica TaxID=1854586 RepID=A0A263CXH1_9PSEU|nr:phosphatase PAP2 family protein [Amycolatopsis antarctica]OZM70026.1 phosphatidic acid phosphatase [Amycolatopsis antarctica]